MPLSNGLHGILGSFFACIVASDDLTVCPTTCYFSNAVGDMQATSRQAVYFTEVTIREADAAFRLQLRCIHVFEG